MTASDSFIGDGLAKSPYRELVEGKSMEANANQIGGKHYREKTIQPWDYIAANDLGFFEGNVVKYVTRWKEKDGLQDLHKARHYLQKLIELNDRSE